MVFILFKNIGILLFYKTNHTNNLLLYQQHQVHIYFKLNTSRIKQQKNLQDFIWMCMKKNVIWLSSGTSFNMQHKKHFFKFNIQSHKFFHRIQLISNQNSLYKKYNLIQVYKKISLRILIQVLNINLKSIVLIKTITQDPIITVRIYRGFQISNQSTLLLGFKIWMLYLRALLLALISWVQLCQQIHIAILI